MRAVARMVPATCVRSRVIMVVRCRFILPRVEFLQALREFCTKHGAALIFDEVRRCVCVGGGGEMDGGSSLVLSFLKRREL